MKNTILGTAVIALVSFGAVGSSFALDCKTDNGTAKKLFAEASAKCAAEGAKDLAECKKLGKFNKIIEALKQGASALNLSVGNNPLTIGTPVTGNVLGGSANVLRPRFSTGILKTEDNAFNVKIDRLDGKAGMDAAICAYDDKGGFTKLGEIKITEGNDKVSKNLNVTGAGGKILQVQLDGNGGTLKRMKFELLVNN
jgi:hypothetical protein